MCEGGEEDDIEMVKQELNRKWTGWKLSFSHFVPLTEEPTDACLWYLLLRRAAGVLSRSPNAVDLLLPIFTCDSNGNNAQVSMVIVRTMDCGPDAVSADRLSSSTTKLFKNCTKRPDEVIRVAMVLGGQLQPRRYYSKGVAASSASDAAVGDSYVLCMNGIETAFVPQDVSDQLDLLLAPWWNVMKMADEDLGRRRCRSVYRIPNETLREIAAMPYSKLLRIEDDESEEQAPAPAEGTKSQPESKRQQQQQGSTSSRSKKKQRSV